jgi:hypothetical protein
MALASVIFALALLGALVSVALQTGLLEHRIARNTAYAAEALAAAESGAALVIADWEGYADIAALAVGGSVALAGIELGNHAAVQPTVVRLTDALYLVTAEGSRTDAGGNLLAQRRIAVLARASGSGIAPLAQRSWVQPQ